VDVKDFENPEIAQKQQSADADQDDWANWEFLAEIVQRITDRLTVDFCLGNAHCVKRHIEDKPSQHEGENKDRAYAEVICIGSFDEAKNDGGENHKVNQSFVVLAVVNRTEAREKTEHKGNGAAWPARVSRGNGCYRWDEIRLVSGRGIGIADGSRRLRRSDTHSGGQAIFAIENIADWASAHRAHRLSAITTKPGCIHLRMDGTLHRILPSQQEGHAAASTMEREAKSFARFCCFGEVGPEPSVLPGFLSEGVDCGVVVS